MAPHTDERQITVDYFFILSAATWFCSVLLVLSQSWHGKLSLDARTGVQKIHTMDAPRVGGIAIALGLVLAYVMAESPQAALMKPLLIAAIPVFAAGLLEDLTKRVGPLPRLLAAMLSGALACGLTGICMQDTGVLAFDWVLQWTPAAVLFTAFAVGGMTNAINIVDGFNGMASGVCIVILLSFAAIAMQQGDQALMLLCMSLACVAFGFAVVNWPSGGLFLGDGGAYLLGLCVAWMAVLLVMRHSDINGWVAVMVCAYPLLEAGFSMRRRSKCSMKKMGTADKRHLHHFIHRRLVSRWVPSHNGLILNSLTSPVVWVLTGLPAAWGVYFAEDSNMLMLGFALATFAYGGLYARVTQFRWCFSAVTMRRGGLVRGG
jgi:UDP-N-acetylmuramyl pentapeptide phosphotransferase/UDP-N-acetylglucosamine-1-phosphate transferase